MTELNDGQTTIHYLSGGSISSAGFRFLFHKPNMHSMCTPKASDENKSRYDLALMMLWSGFRREKLKDKTTPAKIECQK